MSKIENNKQVARRTVLKGAAWSVPVVAAAAAMPVSAASVTNPGCGCLQTGALGAFTAQAVTLLNLGTVTGTLAFNLDSSACDTGFFKPAYTILGLGGSISFSDGTTNQFTIGGTTGAGTIGQISAFDSTFSVLGQINMPNDLIPPYTPKVPTKVCFNFTAIFIPLLPIPQIECSYQLCFDITSPSSLGTIVLGTGTVNWTDLTPSNPVLTPLG
ncbi:hypothetical protein [Microbacterium sp. NPDC056052]|uniref:hypothetical protein n=1 Tax=Microbacterium sp. NPDC056052 TaxID=3345695 RepID=UPI0035DF1197